MARYRCRLYRRDHRLVERKVSHFRWENGGFPIKKKKARGKYLWPFFRIGSFLASVPGTLMAVLMLLVLRPVLVLLLRLRRVVRMIVVVLMLCVVLLRIWVVRIALIRVRVVVRCVCILPVSIRIGGAVAARARWTIRLRVVWPAGVHVCGVCGNNAFAFEDAGVRRGCDRRASMVFGSEHAPIAASHLLVLGLQGRGLDMGFVHGRAFGSR